MSKDEADQASKGWRADRDEFARLRAKYEAGEATWDQVVDAAGRMRTKAARPIMRDLRPTGVRGKDLWDDFDIKSNPAAIAVLVDHLETTELPDDVVQLVGNMVAVKPAAAHWERLRAMYLAPRTAAHKEAAAIALSGCATRERLDELVAFVRDSVADRRECSFSATSSGSAVRPVGTSWSPWRTIPTSRKRQQRC